MTVRPELRWVVLAIAVVALLLGVSALALTKPTVAWLGGKPACPHCRSAVEPYSVRCRACREQYVWRPAPDEDSPHSRWSLSALEDEVLQTRVAALGRDAAAGRAAEALGISPDAARAYLEKVGIGRCGWCGGTEQDLSAPEGRRPPCPACLGRGACVACDGDRRMRRGEEGARAALDRYRAALQEVSPLATAEVQQREVRRLGEEFLARWHGSEEAAEIVFWPLWGARRGETGAPGSGACVVEACRDRLDRVLRALGSE